MNQDQKFSTLISVVLMLATASLGWFTVRDQLALPRIKNLRGAGESPVSEQDVAARLWEDPLLAVQAELARSKTNAVDAHKPDAFKKFVSRKLNEGKRVCMLVVPIPGTSFPDDGEWRLRQRYSLVMALAQSGFQPDGDGRHLGYVTLDWLERERVHPLKALGVTNIDYSVFNANPIEKRLQVPYEWFDSAEPANSLTVLLVWLQTEFLATEPLCRLAYLRDSLMPTDIAATNFAGTFFIGPYTSGELVGIVAASTTLQTNQHICTDLIRDKLCILSPLATAPDTLIGLPATNRWSAARWAMDGMLRKKLKGDPNWTYFKNFIAPDDQLTDLLARELKLRRIDLEKDSDRVLLLTEADTSYGRALPQAFLASVHSLKERFESNSSPTATNLTTVVSDQTVHPNTNLIIARYLQGLDAQKGYQEDNKSGARNIAGKTTAQVLEEALNKQAATPLGDSQLDYSERLAQHLSEGEAKGKVKAVGVLGGDVYDKLILLRSLRSRFPEALFFTTDLDARLWHPDHLRFTRNLIVASAYPVTSTNQNTGFRMAPFRNGYQTAVFNASCAALVLATNALANVPGPPAPEIYELGRNGPVRLEPADAPCLASLTNTWWARFTAARGEVWVWAWNLNHIKKVVRSCCSPLGFGTVLAFLTLWTLYDHRLKPAALENRELRLADIFRARTGWVARFLVVWGVAIVMFASSFYATSLLPSGEPWSWANGVSIWPTELLRITIVLSVIWMLVLAWQRYKRHKNLLEVEFFSRNMPVNNSTPSVCQTWGQFGRMWVGKIRSTVGPFLSSGVYRSWISRLFSRLKKLPSQSKQFILALISLQFYQNHFWPKVQPQSADLADPVEAKQVWEEFVERARGPRRYGRAFSGGLAYFLIAFSLMSFTGLPFNTQVRGGSAQIWDQFFLYVSVIALLFLLFYVLDAVWLSATTLEKLAKPFTVWNEELVRKCANKYGVGREDVEGYLDVKFAAQKTEETGRLIFLPFIIQFLMLVSRNSVFDNWGWPIGLVAILVCNVMLATIAWWLLRRAASKVKSEALGKLGANLMVAELDIAKGTQLMLLPQARKLGLLEIKNRITNEHRGAYSKWIQDPALLAMLLPTGLLGVLTVLFQALFG